MSDMIRVPFEAAESEFTEKRSRFISHIRPVETEEEAQAFIREMKTKYYDARHNCWCYLVGRNTVRYGDDGEPQGTAGQPMLKVFERENVTNVCCVVTRYFGGILLGAGGLTRAYSRGAKDALTAAGVSELGEWATVEIPCAYGLFEQVKLELAARGGVVDGVDYGAAVTVTASVPAENASPLQNRLTELSAGVITVTELRREYRPGPRLEI
ncbi:MAG: YigZ family protein [Oscillospiraceae bacterium]|nr:YigZ family protein [Oscillospiraceae bacterium]